jgi:hypothetical protein
VRGWSPPPGVLEFFHALEAFRSSREVNAARIARDLAKGAADLALPGVHQLVSEGGVGRITPGSSHLT